MSTDSYAERLWAIASGCLFLDSELVDGKPPANAVIVEGIVGDYAFHPERVAAAKPALAAFIRAVVPEPFLKGHGGGWSFLNLCEARDGELWAEHPTLGMLCALAIATGLGGYCLPREFWPSLPGSVPYVWFDAEAA